MKNTQGTRVLKVAAFFTDDEHAELKMFCAKNKTLMKDFIYHSIMYCMNKNNLPKDNK